MQYFVSFSEQQASTDTIAVNNDNTPFREKDDSILFRPAGHGALLENLAVLEADVIFIKNVDNVVPDHLKATTVTYKKAIAGVLLDYQAAIFSYLERLDQEVTEGLLLELDEFFQDASFVCFPQRNSIPGMTLKRQPISAKKWSAPFGCAAWYPTWASRAVGPSGPPMPMGPLRCKL